MARPTRNEGRRNDGDGTIYEVPRQYRLADGSARTKIYFCAEIHWTAPDGTARRERAQRATRTAAREWLARKRIEIASGKAARPDERRVTVGEALEHWIATKSPSLRPSSKAVYESARKHLKALHDRRVLSLTREQVSGCIDDATLSPRMRTVMRMVLRAALRPYVRVIQEDLFPPGSAPKIRRGRLNVWTPEQASAFLGHTANSRLGLLWRTALLTGMRRGELLGLRWKDVHDGWIEVAGSLDATRDLVATKTSGSRRRIDIDVALNEALKKKRGKSDDFVFATANGTSLSPRNVVRDFKLAIASANKPEADRAAREGREPNLIPTIRFHDLRHTHATLLLRANVHPKVVSERLGHASVRMTLDVYSHAVPTMQTAAAAVAADMLTGPGPRPSTKALPTGNAEPAA